MGYERSGGDSRGSAAQRRNSKQWILDTFGDGIHCPCIHCQQELDFTTLERDRIIPGGPYARWNLQPSDRHCNASRSNRLDWIPPTDSKLARKLFKAANARYKRWLETQ